MLTVEARREAERKYRALEELRKRRVREECEASFLTFVERAWSSIDPSPYESNWSIDALCEHLQAVVDGEIRHLLVNFPPRCGKTLVTSVCFPAWIWTRGNVDFLSGPQVRFLCGSYNHDLALQNSNYTRRLVMSDWYRGLWGDRFSLRSDQNTKTRFDNDKGGSRLSTSVGGSLLGVGGDIIIIDDPHNTADVESEVERQTALQWWKEIRTTRLNDPKRSPLIVIMQRLHEEDVSGKILSEARSEFHHLMIPMEYEWNRHCVTSIGWEDPRGLDEDGNSLIHLEPTGDRIPVDGEAERILDNERQGSLMWPERFGPDQIKVMKEEMGPYFASGRLQQMPVPDKGGIFRRDWWQDWDPPNGKYPAFQYILASVDSAFTEDQRNDPSAMTVWGTFIDPETNQVAVMLIDAWRRHLQMHGAVTPRNHREMPVLGDDETVARGKDLLWRDRCGHEWGLVEWVAWMCRFRHVDRLLIEAKASGITAGQEIRRLYGEEGWAVQLCPVKGDKVSRALSVQPLFAQAKIWAPLRKDWAELVVTEMTQFPLGQRDDLTDSTTQALRYMRDNGLLKTSTEIASEERERLMHRGGGRLRPIYNV